MTTTSQGLPIPTVDVSAARSAALRIRQAAGAAEQCLDHLADSAPADWIGQASQAYLEGRAVVSRRATDLAEACAVLDRAVVEFSEEVAAVLPRWRPAAERLDQLELTCSDPARAGLPDATPGQLEVLIRERDALRVEVAAWQQRYDEATLLLSGACSRVMTIIDDGRLSTADQLWAIPETVVQQMVLEPLALVALLADDPSQVDDVAKAAWFGVIDQVRHPGRTAQEMSGVPAYQDGRWGEGIGTGIASVGGMWGGRRAFGGGTHRPGASSPSGGRGSTPLSPEEKTKFERNIQDLDAPLPRAQTLDEMLARVDLDRSEHVERGHTLSRHVDVDDDYLLFRLEHGTPMPDGTYNRPMTEASVWTDRATAESTITEAVRQHQLELRDWISSGEEQVEITVIGGNFGRVMTLVNGAPTTRAADTVTIRLEQTAEGKVFVQTTLLGVVRG